jgi:hypothetical protein
VLLFDGKKQYCDLQQHHPKVLDGLPVPPGAAAGAADAAAKVPAAAAAGEAVGDKSAQQRKRKQPQAFGRSTRARVQQGAIDGAAAPADMWNFVKPHDASAAAAAAAAAAAEAAVTEAAAAGGTDTSHSSAQTHDTAAEQMRVRAGNSKAAAITKAAAISKEAANSKAGAAARDESDGLAKQPVKWQRRVEASKPADASVPAAAAAAACTGTSGTAEDAMRAAAGKPMAAAAADQLEAAAAAAPAAAPAPAAAAAAGRPQGHRKASKRLRLPGEQSGASTPAAAAAAAAAAGGPRQRKAGGSSAGNEELKTLPGADPDQLVAPLLFNEQQQLHQAEYILREALPHLLDMLQQQQAEVGWSGWEWLEVVFD